MMVVHLKVKFSTLFVLTRVEIKIIYENDPEKSEKCPDKAPEKTLKNHIKFSLATLT